MTDVASLAGLSIDEKLELLELLELRDRRKRENWLEHYAPYAKQKEFHTLGATHRERLFMAANQGHPLSHGVLTPTGWRPIGELLVGDSIIAGDGSVCQVTGIADLGEKDIYEVSFDGGNLKVRVTDDHLWATRSAQRGWQVRTTLEVGELALPQWTPACGVVQFPKADLRVDPYLLGVLLGDGSFTSNSVQVSSNDDFILDEVRRLVPETCEVRRSAGARPSDWMVRTTHEGRGRRNDLKDKLERLDLVGLRSEHKRVPAEYLWASPDQRLSLLQGLMDTDGSSRLVGAAVRSTFYSSSPGLIEDVCFLVRSLGGQAKASVRKRAMYRHPRTGVIRPCLPGRTVEIRMPDGVPLFRLPRKLLDPDRTRKPRTLDHKWDGAHLVGRELARCITISHPSRLYVTEGFIVTHNSGKTYSGAAEVAMHATGRYPEWWGGYRFHRPIRATVASESAELTRKGVQRLLLGAPEKRDEWGTGAIPKSHLKNWSMKPGVPDAVSSVTVKNEYGGESVIQFNSYDQGRTKFQADTLDLAWLDEEPPVDVYSEVLTRTNTTGGPLFITFTPLLGMSQVVKRFVKEKPPGTIVTNMTIEDVDHYTPEQRAAIIAAYPEHEREARARGIPMMGSGQVFPVAESSITCEPLPIPPHWARINAIDFGWDHPAAFVCLAHDRDTDTVYVYDAWRMRNKTAAEQSMLIQAKGYKDIPWAWPHDGLQHDKGAGQVLMKQYKGFGINMLGERAKFERTVEGKDGGYSVEAGITQMLERMQTRRLRVFGHLTEWFEEFRQYHRKDGLVVKEDDDLMSATRYGLMMLRKAQTTYEMAAVKPDVMSPIVSAPFQVFDPTVAY